MGDTPLSCAAQGGREEIVERLLEQQGVDPNTENAFQYTPMHEAAENGHTGVVVILHKRHAHLNTLSVSGQTPLMFASIEGHNETVEYLLSIPRANTNVKDEKSGTPLSLPDDSKGGHEEVEVETRDYDGRTSLSWAAKLGHVAVVKLLLYYGNAQVETRDNNDRTPLSWAAEGGHVVVVDLLLQENAQVETKDKDDRTPLPGPLRVGMWRLSTPFLGNMLEFRHAMLAVARRSTIPV